MYTHTPLLSLLPVWTCSPAPLWPMLAPVLPARLGAMSRLWCHWSLALERGSKGEDTWRTARPSAHQNQVPAPRPNPKAPCQSSLHMPSFRACTATLRRPLTLCQYQYFACTQRERAVPQVLDSRPSRASM